MKIRYSYSELGLGVGLLAAVGFGLFSYGETLNDLHLAKLELASSTIVYQTDLAKKTEENKELAAKLEEEQKRNGTFQEQIEEIAGTVGELDKLRKIDPELLIKYSKIYFLNENYAPSRLANIAKEFTLDQSKLYEIHAQVEPFLEKMFKAAAEDGVDLRVASSYRSFATQAAVKSNHLVLYGSGANKFSADQGYSEHQLGTTIDVTTPKLAALVESFDQTEAYEWLGENAYKYGFVLSYPKGNAYYVYEPWHWRFVGEELARRLHKDGKNFYDMDQREIDKYLISIFD